MQLRFPGFEDEWNQFKLQDIVEINPKSSNLPNEFYYIDLGVINNGRLSDNIKKIKLSEAPSRAQRLLEINDILFQTVRPYQKNNFLFLINNKDKKYVSSTGYAQLRTKSIVSTFFTYYMLYAESFIKKVLSLSSGSNYPAVNSKDLSKIMIYLPSIIEQKNIGSLLFNVDMKIRVLENLFGIYQKFKKYLLQQIFGRLAKKLQFDFNEEWREVTFKELLIELNEKTTTNNQHKILSSTKEGIFSQKEYFANRNVASKDNTGYKILRKNQIVLSPQNLWMGNINVNTDFEIGIVSPSYKIYETTDLVEINYFKHIIKLSRLIYEYKCASEQGASIVRRNLNKQLFEEIKINIPSLKEQEKIANFLSAVDKKIDLIQTQIDEMEKFKKGLLQQMFISRINSLIIITIILISLESSHVFRFFF